MPTIAGTFDVSLKHAPVSDPAQSAAIGAMSIEINDGAHSFRFDYELP